MRDVLELSYTGDLLAYRRCSRAWAYEKHAGFHPYEQVQAMEGRLLHHAMEWLTRRFADASRHATRTELEQQLLHYWRVLWARGIRTAFANKQETLKRVADNLFPKGRMDAIVRAVIEGAQHTEYELRSVRKLLGRIPGTKEKFLLTGVLDLVVQQQRPLAYPRLYEWKSRKRLDGRISNRKTKAQPGDVEIWDYKGTRSTTTLLDDYARQLLTYAYLYHERTNQLPARCVLYFVNEPDRKKKLLAIGVDEEIIGRAVEWTHRQAIELQKTLLRYQKDPRSIPGGERMLLSEPLGQRISPDLKAQCTACGLRFDCDEYRSFLKRADHPDISLTNVQKN